VFSPNMLCGGLRSEGLNCTFSRVGLSRPGVGVDDRSLSGDLPSSINSLLACGVPGLVVFFSGDLGEPKDEPPSRKLLKSRTFPVWRDCIRLWAAPLTKDRSGEASIRFAMAFVM